MDYFNFDFFCILELDYGLVQRDGAKSYFIAFFNTE